MPILNVDGYVYTWEKVGKELPSAKEVIIFGCIFNVAKSVSFIEIVTSYDNGIILAGHRISDVGNPLYRGTLERYKQRTSKGRLSYERFGSSSIQK